MTKRNTNYDLSTREKRSKLASRGKPYFRILETAVHLGYRRLRGHRGKPGSGTWVLRQYQGAGTYRVSRLATADDLRDADGTLVLNYSQAHALALKRAIAHAKADRDERVTVKAVIDDYLSYLEAEKKCGYDSRARAYAHIVPALGHVEVSALTTTQIRRWHQALAKAPARVRSAKGKAPAFRALDLSDEGVRRRKLSANRVLTILLGALNRAYGDDRVSSDAAWRRVRPFKNVSSAKIRYLTADEATRLVNVAAQEPHGFRNLVLAALATGARYGELTRFTVSDFNPDAGTVTVWTSKSNKPRHIMLAAEGVALFRQLCAGRAGSDLILRRDDGGAWLRSNQAPPLLRSCVRAGIIPPIAFHILRHSWASLSVMNGLPLAVASANLGHADLRMTTKHYAHLAPDYVSDEIRKHVPSFGFEADTTIVPLDASRPRR